MDEVGGVLLLLSGFSLGAWWAARQFLLHGRLDPKTGCLSPDFFLFLLRKEMARAQRTGKPFTLLFLDLDGFKEVNDRYGHLRGDEVLAAAVEAMRRAMREEDVVCRWGGDEFCVLLAPGANDEAAAIRIRREVAEATGLGVSVGRSRWHPEVREPEEMVREADEDMYRDKRSRKTG